MAGFKAEGVVEPLDYDFRTKQNPNAPHGTTPEPTDKHIAAFLKGMKDIAQEAKEDLPEGIDASDPGAIMAALDDLDPEAMEHLTGQMCKLFAALASGTPSEQEILSLPPRVRTVYFAWFQTEVMSPEAVTGGGKAPVTNLRTARAG